MMRDRLRPLAETVAEVERREAAGPFAEARIALHFARAELNRRRLECTEPPGRPAARRTCRGSGRPRGRPRRRARPPDDGDGDPGPRPARLQQEAGR